MHQPQPPDPDPDDDLERLGQPIYQGDGLQVRGLTEEELTRFLAAHAGQPAHLLGSGWANLEPRTADEHVEAERRLTFKRQLFDSTGPASTIPIPTHSTPPTGSYGTPGASARAVYRRLRAAELADWRRGLLWRLPLVAGAGIGAAVLTGPLPSVVRLTASLAAVGAVGWRLRYRASGEASAWRKGARGERRTARRLRRLARRGYVAFHDLAMPGSRANIDHLLLGPSGVFVIDSKQYTGRVEQTPDGHVWHNHYPLDEQLQTVREEARAVEAILDVPVIPLLCVHGASVQWGGLRAQGVAIVPAGQLRGALGADVVLSAEQVAVLAGTALMCLHPAG
jgi:Nuclease-related domain